MENILIIDADRAAGKTSAFPNLALAKIGKFHKDRGDKVFFDFPLIFPTCEKIYVSCVFEKSRPAAAEWVERGAFIGGTGWDFLTTLPPEIEAVQPRINLGFTSRGCVRNCPWCVVPRKEGHVRAVGDILELWDGKAREIKIMDNNILALPEHFALQCALAKSKGVKIDFNQGLDLRLVDDRAADLLAEVRSEHLRFSWDSLDDEAAIFRGLGLILKRVPASRVMMFMMVNFSSSVAEDFYRYDRLHRLGVSVYVMIFEDGGKLAPRLLKEFKYWANNFKLRGLPFRRFLAHRKCGHLWPTEFESDVLARSTVFSL